MNVLVTGGAGFIGRWIVNSLLDKDVHVTVFDNLSNGQESNIEEFKDHPFFLGLIVGDVADKAVVDSLFEKKFDVCIHAAAQINVQESLDYPKRSFDSNIVGTFNILESAKIHNTKLVLMGTCMVYDLASEIAISEIHPVKPASPYAASKLAAEELALSYFHGFNLPVVIVRPFNTYGPFQKSNMEGGVISIFCKRELENQTLNIFGDGSQTRDLLYVEDCADFLTQVALSDKFNGEIFNIGLGRDVSVNDLASMICKDSERIMHVVHHHPQAEIPKLLCDFSKANRVFGWSPKTSLEHGISKTLEWLKNS